MLRRGANSLSGSEWCIACRWVAADESWRVSIKRPIFRSLCPQAILDSYIEWSFAGRYSAHLTRASDTRRHVDRTHACACADITPTMPRWIVHKPCTSALHDYLSGKKVSRHPWRAIIGRECGSMCDRYSTRENPRGIAETRSALSPSRRYGRNRHLICGFVRRIPEANPIGNDPARLGRSGINAEGPCETSTNRPPH